MAAASRQHPQIHAGSVPQLRGRQTQAQGTSSPGSTEAEAQLLPSLDAAPGTRVPFARKPVPALGLPHAGP